MNHKSALFISILLTAASVAEALTPSEIYAISEESSFELLVNGRLEGTGFIISPDGYAGSVFHAMKDHANLEIRSPLLGRLPVSLIAHNRGVDTVLLKLPCREKPYKYLCLNSTIPAPGDSIYLMGTPIFRHRVFIPGTVARKGTTFEYFNGNYVEVLHATGIAAKGCSGGPWLDKQGKVIGMQAANITIRDSHQGIASLVPAYSIQQLLDKKVDIHLPTLQMAVEAVWEQAPGYINGLPSKTKGLVIRQVAKNGIAAKAGVKEWDILLTINGKQFLESAEFVRYLRSQPGDLTHELEIMDKDGKNLRTLKLKPHLLP